MPWIIDAAHSYVGFSVRHMMVTTVRGRFTSFSGSLELDPTDFTRSSAVGEVDVASVSTENADRDNHLRTGDFFDVAQHPKMSFRSTRIEKKDDERYVVHGELTLRGVTREVALDVEYAGVSRNPWGKNIVGVSASGTIRRQDFGVNFHQLLETGGVAVSDKVKLELELQAVEQG